MKPATRHKMKIAGIEVETFPTTLKGKYVRGYRAYHQTYWRLVDEGSTVLGGDEVWTGQSWTLALLRYASRQYYYRRRVGRKP